VVVLSSPKLDEPILSGIPKKCRAKSSISPAVPCSKYFVRKQNFVWLQSTAVVSHLLVLNLNDSRL
jgi:hypothetical protein